MIGRFCGAFVDQGGKMSDENSGNVCQAHNGHAGEQGVGDQ